MPEAAPEILILTQHASITADRWSAFSFDQQILMIANELNRARKLTFPDDGARLEHAYDRVLHLTDLTIQTAPRRSARRELLRWRDLIASLYVMDDEVSPLAALRCLLRFTPEALRQLGALGLDRRKADR